MAEVKDDGVVELDMVELEICAKVGLELILACTFAGVTTKEIIQDIIDQTVNRIDNDE
jgi:hypothetical protein